MYRPKPMAVRSRVRALDADAPAVEAPWFIGSRIALAVNAPPVNSVPGSQEIIENFTAVFSAGGANGITVSDPDAGSAVVQVTLPVDHGTLTLPSGASGLTFLVGNGHADTTMTFTGTIDHINGSMQGLTYNPNFNFKGVDTLTITTNDLGNSGTGGAQIDTDTVTITVDATNDTPVIANLGGDIVTFIDGPTAVRLDAGGKFATLQPGLGINASDFQII
jgi:hypothetical protein